MLDSQELFSGHGIRVTLDTAELPDGVRKTTARAHRPDVVHILAFTADEKILLLREYRPFYAAHVWMLPSGHIDKESDPDTAAQRELQEETGYRAKTIECDCVTDVAERLVTRNFFYIARDLVPDPLPQDDDERIEVHELTLPEALRKVQESPHRHLPSEAAILRFLHSQKA